MTHQLLVLASGKVVVVLEGDYNLATISDCATQCDKALLGDPLPTVLIGQAKESAVQTVRDVVRQQRQYWQCLVDMDKIRPLEVGGGDEDSLVGVEDQLDQLCLGTSRSGVRSEQVKQTEAASEVDQSNDATENAFNNSEQSVLLEI